MEFRMPPAICNDLAGPALEGSVARCRRRSSPTVERESDPSDDRGQPRDASQSCDWVEQGGRACSPGGAGHACVSTARGTRGVLSSGPGQVGMRIADRYRLIQRLAAGGQASIWEAQDCVLHAPIAAKIVSGAADPIRVERLLREANIAAQLRHPAVARVFDAGQTENGIAFLIMELLEGETLSQRLARHGPLPAADALPLLLPIADALRAAHARGVIHRDVKPDNVFLALAPGSVHPKLLDFGVAKLCGAGTARRELTATGEVVGSPAYLSPEQARGGNEVDERTDVWSFCATLYECLTGEVPFVRDNCPSLLRAVMEAEPKPLRDSGVEDGALSNIVLRGLRKSPEERWPSMNALGRALAWWLLDRGVTHDVVGGSLREQWVESCPSQPRVAPLQATMLSFPPTIPSALDSFQEGIPTRVAGSCRTARRSHRSHPPGPPRAPRANATVLAGVSTAAVLTMAALLAGEWSSVSATGTRSPECKTPPLEQGITARVTAVHGAREADDPTPGEGSRTGLRVVPSSTWAPEWKSKDEASASKSAGSPQPHPLEDVARAGRALLVAEGQQPSAPWAASHGVPRPHHAGVHIAAVGGSADRVPPRSALEPDGRGGGLASDLLVPY